MKTLILGLGNPVRHDDGVGNRIAQILKDKIENPEVTVSETTTFGFALLDYLAGYERVIIIDAVQTEGGKVGQIYRLSLQDIATPNTSFETHTVSLATILELGTRLEMSMPKEVVIFAIEVADVTSFEETLTSEVEEAVPEVARLVLSELDGAR